MPRHSLNVKLSDIFGSLSDYDGVLLVVSDANGPAIISGVATRVQQGVQWVRPDMNGGGGGGGDTIGGVVTSTPPAS
jgi:hypothetical protein